MGRPRRERRLLQEARSKETVEPLMTSEGVATMLGVPRATIYAWRYRNDGPPAHRIGKYLRFKRADVEAWLATKRDPPSGTTS